jgi:phenylalanyl-tRNA synthetase beta chain
LHIFGFEINDNIIETALKKRNFLFSKKIDYWLVSIPYDRYDITTEENVISEILKYHGYNNIPLIPIKTNVMIKENDVVIIKQKISDYLIFSGFHEVVNYSFVNSVVEKTITEKEMIFITNPFSDNMNVMRTSLLQGLLKNMSTNLNRGINDLKLFEIGNVWNNSTTMSDLNCACICTELLYYKNYYNTESTFFAIKNLAENVFQKIFKINTFKLKKNLKIYLHENIRADITLYGSTVGTIGLLNKNILKIFHIKKKIFFLELFLNKITKNLQTTCFTDISKYPKIERDVSFIVNQNISYDDLLDQLSSFKIHYLKSIRLKNIYNIDKKNKSITINFTFQSMTETLVDTDINTIIQNLCKKMTENTQILVKGF